MKLSHLVAACALTAALTPVAHAQESALLNELHRLERSHLVASDATIAHMIQTACRFQVIKTSDLELAARAVSKTYPDAYRRGLALARRYLQEARYMSGEGDCRHGRKLVDNMRETMTMAVEVLRSEGFR